MSYKETVNQAIDLCSQLQLWLEDVEDLSAVPVAHVQCQQTADEIRLRLGSVGILVNDVAI